MIAKRMKITPNEFCGEILNFSGSVTSVLKLKTIVRDARRSRWFPLLAIAGGAVLGIVAIKLIALLGAAFDISFLRDVGNNVTPGGAAGGAGAGAGGGWPGGKDPYPMIGSGDGNSSGGSGGGQGGGGTGGPPDGKDPWWKDWIPHTIPTALGTGLNVFTGRVEGPGFSVGAAPGSDPSGAIVDVNYGVPGVGSRGPQGTASVSINQQNVPLTGAGSTTPTGRQILNASMSSDGTFNNTGN